MQEELKELIDSIGARGEVELFLYRRGYESEGVMPVVKALEAAHREVTGTPLELADPPYSSMWREVMLLMKRVYQL
ncbi:5-nitroanthranilic acid aminohydrolase [Neomoorella glycerini]|uniref:5-nitroanthranilic acid aminohydrolase n=1 Tax=Neomoorella glycerini TaxID=55779 RepID=A0A6I5ZLQ9_9FIRM|nr:hypothetical protein [Moorella glycerini]QGP90802.1 5-nitroanthranilic acid aminohydrolase [Moorella glycerini]